MTEPPAGFAVIYRWRLHPGMERQFQQAWERSTPLLMHQRGALGSRLYKGEDGTWFAYALWPNKLTWEQSRALPSVDPEASHQMLEAEAEAFAPVLLTPVADYLTRSAVHSAI